MLMKCGHTCSQFHQHFTSCFCSDFLLPKNYKHKLSAHKSCPKDFRTKKAGRKCWWNWHLLAEAGEEDEQFLFRQGLSETNPFAGSECNHSLILHEISVCKWIGIIWSDFEWLFFKLQTIPLDQWNVIFFFIGGPLKVKKKIHNPRTSQ